MSQKLEHVPGPDLSVAQLPQKHNSYCISLLLIIAIVLFLTNPSKDARIFFFLEFSVVLVFGQTLRNPQHNFFLLHFV